MDVKAPAPRLRLKIKLGTKLGGPKELTEDPSARARLKRAELPASFPDIGVCIASIVEVLRANEPSGASRLLPSWDAALLDLPTQGSSRGWLSSAGGGSGGHAARPHKRARPCGALAQPPASVATRPAGPSVSRPVPPAPVLVSPATTPVPPAAAPVPPVTAAVPPAPSSVPTRAVGPAQLRAAATAAAAGAAGAEKAKDSREPMDCECGLQEAAVPSESTSPPAPPPPPREAAAGPALAGPPAPSSVSAASSLQASGATRAGGEAGGTGRGGSVGEEASAGETSKGASADGSEGPPPRDSAPPTAARAAAAAPVSVPRRPPAPELRASPTSPASPAASGCAPECVGTAAAECVGTAAAAAGTPHKAVAAAKGVPQAGNRPPVAGKASSSEQDAVTTVFHSTSPALEDVDNHDGGRGARATAPLSAARQRGAKPPPPPSSPLPPTVSRSSLAAVSSPHSPPSARRAAAAAAADKAAPPTASTSGRSADTQTGSSRPVLPTSFLGAPPTTCGRGGCGGGGMSSLPCLVVSLPDLQMRPPPARPPAVSEAHVASAIARAKALKREGDKMAAQEGHWRAGSLCCYPDAALKFMEACELYLAMPRSAVNANNASTLYGQTADLLWAAVGVTERTRCSEHAREALRILCERLCGVCCLRQAAVMGAARHTEQAEVVAAMAAKHAAQPHGPSRQSADGKPSQRSPDDSTNSTTHDAATATTAAQPAAASAASEPPPPPPPPPQLPAKVAANARHMALWVECTRRSVSALQAFAERPDVRGSAAARRACVHLSNVGMDAGMGDLRHLAQHAQQALHHIRTLG